MGSPFFFKCLLALGVTLKWHWQRITWLPSIDRLLERWLILLKQLLARMNDWLTKAEKRMQVTDEKGIDFENLKKQLEDNQVGKTGRRRQGRTNPQGSTCISRSK